MKDWIKIGGIAGIILLVLALFKTVKYYLLIIKADNLLSYINNLEFFPINLLSDICLILLFLGFLFVAKKYNKKFLKIIVLLTLIVDIISLIYTLPSYLLLYFPSVFVDFFTSTFYTYSSMSIYIILGILELLFGIGLMTLKKINKLSFITGILTLSSFVIELIVAGFILIKISQIQNADLIFLISLIFFVFSLIIILLKIIILFQLSKLKTNEKLKRKHKK